LFGVFVDEIADQALVFETTFTGIGLEQGNASFAEFQGHLDVFFLENQVRWSR
jgi:hypothetical protein